MAEALAELLAPPHPRGVGLRRRGRPHLPGLFRQQYRGGRYSWGYPACPDLEDNAKVAELLGPAASASR
jgi:5-methyltetrahydrofolate--homocysteine methyltransferase